MRVHGCDLRRALEIVARLASGGAREREPRSGERIRAGRGLPPPAAKRPGSNSQSVQSARAEVLAKLDATNRRLAAIDATNRAASQALATACEPDRVAEPVNVHRVVWLAGYIYRNRKAEGVVVPPEPIEYLPDASGNPPVPRALIPRDGEPCRCPRCKRAGRG
jgi:hypothetical protein